MLIGKIGFGKIYADHLKNVGNLMIRRIAQNILQENLEIFFQDSDQFYRNGVLWKDHDAARAIMAEGQVAAP